MLGANQYVLTWEHFAQLHENRRTAFENLCRSLFQRELCAEGTILHSDPQHPGVEVVPILAKDGKNYISFQAKYFDNEIGYNQIKKSAEKIIGHYKGKLDLIYLYCNKDITTTSKAYRDIEKLLNNVGIKIILVTGQTILDQSVEYPTILSCYFGLDCLDDAWFQKNLQLSLDNLGKRYNSLFNVDTDAQRNLAIFLRESEGITAVNDKKKNLIDEIKDLKWRCDEKYKHYIGTLIETVKSIPDINAKTILNALEWNSDFSKKCKAIFDDLQNFRASLYVDMECVQARDSKYDNLRNKVYVVDRLLSLPEFLSFSEVEKLYITSRQMLVTGEMGTGKSQLLATAAKRTIESNRPTLLLLGQTYISEDNIELQIMNGFDGIDARQSLESLLAVIDEKCYAGCGDAVVFIDAINESRSREVWKNGINRLRVFLEHYKNIRLVISVRTGFEALTLSEKMLEDCKNNKIATIVHYGFADNTPESVYEFLSHYGIPFSPEYYLQSEMTNPLFLTWFCQTYTGEEQELVSLIDEVLAQADREGSKEAGYKEPVEILKPLIYDFIDMADQNAVKKQNLLSLPSWSTYGVTNKIAYIKAIERTGVLTSYVRNQEEIFYIGYNLLEDYFHANRIIEKEKDKSKIKEYCKKQLLGIDENGRITYFGNESIFAMLSSLYAMKYGEECIDIVDAISDSWDKNRILDQYFTMFAWRSSHIAFDDFLDLVNKYPVAPKRIWSVFIENATKEYSELNAHGLTKILGRYDLNQRDYFWTMEINELNEYDRIVNLVYFIEEGKAFEQMSKKKAFLLLILFSWMLSSSNRTLRDRVSKAMIEVLKSQFDLCKALLEQFSNVNDPYIIQRLYGIVFGAVMKRNSPYKDNFAELASWIYSEVFMKEYVYPDILLRDYARLIVERFAYEYPDELTELDIVKVRPPYRSEPIPIVEEVDYTDEKFHQKGMWSLLDSMKFDLPVKGIGLYGDFGRYTLQSALGNFIGLDVANVYYYAIDYILRELGYTSEYFGEYDSKKASFDRHHVKKIERIGKKYQWITMYNVLARASDVYNIKGGNWNDKVGTAYQGSWEPYVRDFDPTLNKRIKPFENIPKIELPEYEDDSFLSFDASITDIDVWILTDDKLFQDFPKRLVHEDEVGREWVSLYSYQEHKIQPPNKEVSVMGFPVGEQHIWSIASMYIAINESEKLTVEKLQTAGFSESISAYTRDCYSLFSREYAWSPGYEAEFQQYEGDEYREASIVSIPASINILWEEEYDASQDETTSFMIPTGHIIQEMGLYEKAIDGIYYCENEIAAFDLSIIGNKQKELVIRRDILNKYMKKTDAKLFWVVDGEKQFFLGGHNQKWQRRQGYFVYESDEIKGSINIVDNI